MFIRPSLQQLITRAQSDVTSRLPGTDPTLRNTVLGAQARAHAGATHGLYGYLEWISRQILPDTADDDWLDRQALWRAGLTRLVAEAAIGNVTFAGTNGATIDAGTALQDATGALYTTNALATIAAGVAVAAVTAQTAGAAGNLAVGTSLTLVSPVAGVQSQATVAAGGFTGGADIETSERLRVRLANALSNPPQGGSQQDYITWALAAHPDVTNVWPVANEMGPGTMTVRLMTYGVTANGIPVQAVLDDVFAYIDARRPAGMAGLYVVAPVAAPLAFTITGITPNTQAVKDAVAAELADLLEREAEPGGTILISHLREAISLAAGESDHALTIPAANVTHTTGQIATMGAITWA
jgi:uncharacterized phage protein gp47/JayE